jgi:hypothetical protein
MLDSRRIAVHTQQAQLRPFSGFPSAPFTKVVKRKVMSEDDSANTLPRLRFLGKRDA